MPHQCLKCGLIFEEGSAQLLKGCPDCGGNRFFFTKEPLDENERRAKEENVSKDINSVLIDIITEENPDLVDKEGKWVKIKPKDVRKVIKKHLTKEKRMESEKKEDINILTDDDYRSEKIEEIQAQSDYSDKPETIKIERPGSYKIDLKGLLEEEPIIIQKDGSYTIHLPSLFKMANIRIRRYIKIRAEANPYDPEWEEYFTQREKYRKEVKTFLSRNCTLQTTWLPGD